MDPKLSAQDLADNLSEILDRVRGGERFAIECDGQVVAVLAPPTPHPEVTGRELADALRGIPRPDDAFADDLDEIHATQGLVGRPR
jgi:antitoxin (DNA-binding transcriptional repressor) of toxin-antitoxin stability system